MICRIRQVPAVTRGVRIVGIIGAELQWDARVHAKPVLSIDARAQLERFSRESLGRPASGAQAAVVGQDKRVVRQDVSGVRHAPAERGMFLGGSGHPDQCKQTNEQDTSHHDDLLKSAPLWDERARVYFHAIIVASAEDALLATHTSCGRPSVAHVRGPTPVLLASPSLTVSRPDSHLRASVRTPTSGYSVQAVEPPLVQRVE